MHISILQPTSGCSMHDTHIKKGSEAMACSCRDSCGHLLLQAVCIKASLTDAWCHFNKQTFELNSDGSCVSMKLLQFIYNQSMK